MDSRRWRVTATVGVVVVLALGLVLAAAERPGLAWSLMILVLLATSGYWADYVLRRRHLPPAD